MSGERLLQEGIQAARAGDLERARAILRRAVQADPASEESWWWLGQCLTAADQRAYCFKRTLALNPGHEGARRSLEALVRLAPELGPVPPPLSTKPQVKRIPVEVFRDGEPAARRGPPASPSEPVAGVFFRAAGLALGLITLMAVALLAAASGGFGGLLRSRLPTVSPSAVVSHAPQESLSSLAPSATPVTSPTPPERPVGSPTPPTPTATYEEWLRGIFPGLREAEAVMAEGDCEQVLPLWDEVVLQLPEYAEAYYQRAICSLQLASDQRLLEAYRELLNDALADLDRAIALGPASGDYYLARGQVFDRLAGIETFRVDMDALLELALENFRVANRMGTSDAFSERVEPFLLFDLGRCEEGLALTEQLLAATDPSEGPSAGLNTALAEGYLCAGRLDLALQHIDVALEVQPSLERAWIRAVVLYDMGRPGEALSQLDAMVAEAPDDMGYRYYLRALIHYERGDLGSAQTDLVIGSSQTWGDRGLIAYIQGRLALDEGDEEAGLEKIRYAEATLTREYGSLLDRLRLEVAQLGMTLLSPTPSIAFDPTPIPTPQVTAAAPISGE